MTYIMIQSNKYYQSNYSFNNRSIQRPIGANYTLEEPRPLEGWGYNYEPGQILHGNNTFGDNFHFSTRPTNRFAGINIIDDDEESELALNMEQEEIQPFSHETMLNSTARIDEEANPATEEALGEAELEEGIEETTFADVGIGTILAVNAFGGQLIAGALDKADRVEITKRENEIATGSGDLNQFKLTQAGRDFSEQLTERESVRDMTSAFGPVGELVGMAFQQPIETQPVEVASSEGPVKI